MDEKLTGSPKNFMLWREHFDKWALEKKFLVKGFYCGKECVIYENSHICIHKKLETEFSTNLKFLKEKSVNGFWSHVKNIKMQHLSIKLQGKLNHNGVDKHLLAEIL